MRQTPQARCAGAAATRRAGVSYTARMEIEEIRDCTQPWAAPAWSLRFGSAEGTPAWQLAAGGPGVRHLEWPQGAALVAGQPRPEQAPGPYQRDAEPDPGLALVQAVAQGGSAALRRVEGPWALVYWDSESGQLLAAVDRLARIPLHLSWHRQAWHLAEDADRLAATLGLEPAAERLAQIAAGTPLALGETAYPGIACLLPGSHLRLGVDGSQHAGVHGSWRQERRDRRPAVLVAGEFCERLKSALRLLTEQGPLLLLAEGAVEGALVAASLAQLPGPQPELWYLPSLSPAPQSFWEAVAQQFGLRFQALPADTAGEAPAPAAAQPSRDAHFRARPGLAALARAAHRLDAQRPAGARPALLLSAAGFDLMLPQRPWPLFSRTAWKGLGTAAPAPVSAHGAALAKALGRDWQPGLAAALSGSGMGLAWPMLDETVAHFLANLPGPLRHGRPWSADLRRRVLGELLPARLRAAAQAADLSRPTGS